MTYLLDTCLVSELVSPKPHPSVVQWMRSQDYAKLYLSVVTMGEIAKGICKLVPSKRKQRLQRWLDEDLAHQFSGRILGFDIQTMRLWGNLVGQLEQEGRPLPVLDSLIAATALEHSLSLVTRNESDFAGTTVTIVNPWVSSG